MMVHYVCIEKKEKSNSRIKNNFDFFNEITVSPPKLKRITQDPSPRTNHEDVQKSQTYQQFVRTMESEIKRLDSDSVYNNG